jgi:hypothetical protein
MNELKDIRKKQTTIVALIEEQNRKFENELLTTVHSLTNMIEGMSTIRYYALRTEPPSLDELRDGPLTCFQDLTSIIEGQTKIKKLSLEEYFKDRAMFVLGRIIELAGLRKVDPKDLLSFLIEEIGQEKLTEYLNLNEVVSAYGVEEAKNWKNLLS